MHLHLSSATSLIINKYRAPLNEENILFLKLLHSDNTPEKLKVKCREWLILHNLRIVMWIISNHYPAISIDHNEIFSVGISALIKSIDRFNIDKHTKLSVYVFFWVRKEVNRYLSKFTGMVQLPNNITETKIASLIKNGNYANIEDFKKDNPKYKHLSSKSIGNSLKYDEVTIDHNFVFVEDSSSKNAEFDYLFKKILIERIEEIDSKIVTSLNLQIDEKGLYEIFNYDQDMEKLNLIDGSECGEIESNRWLKYT